MKELTALNIVGGWNKLLVCTASLGTKKFIYEHWKNDASWLPWLLHPVAVAKVQ